MSKINENGQFLPLVFTDFPPSLELKAERELNETILNKETCLNKMKELIAAETKRFCTDDDFLMMFLRVKKYDVESTFRTLKNYANVRRAQRKQFESIEFGKVKKILDSGVVGLLPKRDHEGRAIMFFDASKFSSDNCNFDDVMSAVHAVTHFALSFPATQVNGICFISNSSIPSFEVFQLFCQCAKTFGPTVAHLHGDQKDSLIKIFPPDILPVELGGSLCSLKDSCKDWINEFERFVPTLVSTCAFYQD